MVVTNYDCKDFPTAGFFGDHHTYGTTMIIELKLFKEEWRSKSIYDPVDVVLRA
ncbi:hypothetical protein BY996DRAFT_6453623 [Phakopsora pachyrhizi]|nr:hypothetical protein BY996DRAFT_6453623 [Phakopsora pachyrhizi]